MRQMRGARYINAGDRYHCQDIDNHFVRLNENTKINRKARVPIFQPRTCVGTLGFFDTERVEAYKG
jgi:hypothetical protein